MVAMPGTMHTLPAHDVTTSWRPRGTPARSRFVAVWPRGKTAQTPCAHRRSRGTPLFTFCNVATSLKSRMWLMVSPWPGSDSDHVRLTSAAVRLRSRLPVHTAPSGLLQSRLHWGDSLFVRASCVQVIRVVA